MTKAELADRIEGLSQPRWVAGLASCGAWSIFGLIGALMRANGYERAGELIGDLGLLAIFLVWFEVRIRFKEVAKELRAYELGDG